MKHPMDFDPSPGKEWAFCTLLSVSHCLGAAPGRRQVSSPVRQLLFD